MSFLTLLIVAFGGVFGVLYPLMRYVPLCTSSCGLIWSPRLSICKFLGIFDTGISFFLIMGTWIGISTAVTGIGMVVFNTATGIGISCGIYVVQKVFIPRWQEQYQEQKLLKQEEKRERKNGKIK